MTDLLPLTRLHLAAAHADAMLDYLRAALPNEGCGLLAVPEAGEAVVKVFPVRNIASLPRVRYEGEPLELLDAFIEMERQQWRLAAIYHSHPNSPAWPSAEDVRQARYPSALTLIVSLTRPDAPEFGLFSLRDGQISQRELVREPAAVMTNTR